MSVVAYKVMKQMEQVWQRPGRMISDIVQCAKKPVWQAAWSHLALRPMVDLVLPTMRSLQYHDCRVSASASAGASA